MGCPICSNPQAKEELLDPLAQNVEIDCHRCGRFKVTDEFRLTRPPLSTEQIANASGWIHEHSIGLHLNKNDWEFLKSIRTPSVGDKAEKLLLYLANWYPHPDIQITVHPRLDEISACWAVGPDEVIYLVSDYLRDYKEYLQPCYPDLGMPVKISPKGWDYIYTIRNPNINSNLGFCAMWFDKSLDALWEEGIEPGVGKAGYLAKRIDKHPHNNRIDDEIIAMIRRSKFIVADFTGNRGGVYFEAGYALGMGLQVIWTVKENELKKVHFDNRQYSFLTWTPDKMAEFRENLQYRIEATIGRGTE